MVEDPRFLVSCDNWLQIWSLYADIEEAFGTLESCQAVYERIIDLRIATPQVVVNYAKFLEENNYFENAFKVVFFLFLNLVLGFLCHILNSIYIRILERNKSSVN